MIRSLYIDNFKALNDFTIEMKPLTVLIGANASGKTSILQALDLISNFIQMDIDAYLEQRKWKPSELKSKSNKKLNMTFRLQLELVVNQCSKLIEWEFVLNPVKAKEKVFVISEKIFDKTEQRQLLSVHSQGISRFNFLKDEMEEFPALSITSSFLKNIDTKDKMKFPELVTLIDFFTDSDSFELLSPEKMRQTSRGDTNTIGMGGEKLAAFIHRLKPEQRRNVSDRLQRYVPFINEVNAEAKGRPGWLEVKLSERFPMEERNFSVSPAHISDGILRMLGIAALIEIDKMSGMVLLDEIEDGINPHIAKEVVSDLLELTKKKHRQVIVTTHSSVMLDYFPEESIVFIWRSSDGVVHNQAMFSKEDMRARLEYMYPGEVWLNMKEKEIIENLQGE